MRPGRGGRLARPDLACAVRAGAVHRFGRPGLLLEKAWSAVRQGVACPRPSTFDRAIRVKMRLTVPVGRWLFQRPWRTGHERRHAAGGSRFRNAAACRLCLGMSGSPDGVERLGASERCPAGRARSDGSIASLRCPAGRAGSRRRTGYVQASGNPDSAAGRHGGFLHVSGPNPRDTSGRVATPSVGTADRSRGDDAFQQHPAFSRGRHLPAFA